jgi:FkbM family methyltransferase
MISRLYRYFYRTWPVPTKVRFYHGQKVFLPRAGYSDLVLQEYGAYELLNSRILKQLARPHSWVLDVGTNLGLMTIPVLADCPEVQVLSFEPSENAQKYLRQTMQESSFKNRWILVPKCVGGHVGAVEFTLSAGTCVEFDGIRHTGRVKASRTCQVPMTTLDEEWKRLGYPAISVIKSDVEGAELGVLQGAAHCIAKERPFVLMEWNKSNFQAYGVTTADLVKLVEELAFDIYALPHMIPITKRSEMELQMMVTESFLLAPRGQ